MTKPVTIDMPLYLTTEMIEAVRTSSLTSIENAEDWYTRLGWLVCAYSVIIEQRKQNPHI